MKKRKDDGRLLETFVHSAAKVLAPNSLQFNEHEFQRSPQEAQVAAREAAKLVQPGDLIFITTSGFLYSVGRYLTNNEYDHVAVVLDKSHVLHVGPPQAKRLELERILLPHRQPVVLRVPMTDSDRIKFLRCVQQLEGCKYDITRAYQLVLRLTLSHMLQTQPLPKLPLDTRNNTWICSDAIMVLLTGCSQRFRDALIKAREKTELDIFTHGSASLSDFSRIRKVDPDALTRVALPIVNYTLVPQQRSLPSYAPELVQFITRWHAGQIKWPLLEELVFPRMKHAVHQIVPGDWPWKQKAQLLGYMVVLLVIFRRGFTVSGVLMKAAQLALLRYVCQELVRYYEARKIKQLVSKL